MKKLPGLLLIVTGILLFLAAGLQIFGLVVVFSDYYSAGNWLGLFKRGLVILALGTLAFLSFRAGLHIMKKHI